MVEKIREAFKIKEKRNWEKTYFMFDIHGTILVPSYEKKEEYEFYPYAKEALQLITNNPEIVNILWSCTSDNNLKKYFSFFKENNIHFDYINENPEIVNTELASFDKKLYCSVGFDDKFGFNPQEDWERIYRYFANLEYDKYTVEDLKSMYEGNYYQLHEDTGELIYVVKVINFSERCGKSSLKMEYFYVEPNRSIGKTDWDVEHRYLIPITKEEFIKEVNIVKQKFEIWQ